MSGGTGTAPAAAEVRELIEKAGGTTAAAETLGVKPATLRTWRGQRPIPAARLEALREAAARAQSGELVPEEVATGGALELRAEDVRHALAEVEDAGAALDVSDKATALKVYLRRQREASAAWIEAAASALWARRRVGELLPPPGKGGRGQTVERPDGLSKDDASVCRRLAALPEDVFAGQIEEWREREKEPTTAGLLRLQKRREREASAAREVVVEAEPSRPIEREVDPEVAAGLVPPDLDDFDAGCVGAACADEPRQVARQLRESLEFLAGLAVGEGLAEVRDLIERAAKAAERAA